ncbi:Tim44 domain-containing protein [Maridesulfovibrio hydrothermalis]|uniref:Import inner membrane translocase subunit Tim44 n=1 Tax=Maridesulfovibrio hydrothermalis AM13 = DSM 14728 TaxID=1121451 RepID=L0RGL0_9BACT|nr:TIM44-like domain-containing protein [Maridesulfovibrio hydrothermalis]CCO24716.1 Import inner membrane translocase subunit Tim44 [Maridesulfovibrio hydrothermalis AM13 = DSM 14728]
MKLLGYLVLPLTLFCLLAVMAGDADAKRMGGGRSFGSKPSFSKSFKKPTSTATTQRQGAGANKQQGGIARPGMGMLGGLLAGTFLGSMLGGFGGMGGGGGFFNILILGLLAYLAFRFFKSRKQSSDQTHRQGNFTRGPTSAQPAQNMNNDPYARREEASQGAWDHLSSKPAGGNAASGAEEQQTGPVVSVPAGFDEEEFLEGAKAVYNRLQKAWDIRDMNDIAQFATPAVLNEIKQQAQEDPGPSQTDIMMVNARLLEAKEEGSKTFATVYYDVLLREDPSQSQPSQVREVWHFVRDGGNEVMWKLDGIQQLED